VPLLELTGVSKAFGGLQVISDLDFHVDENEIVTRSTSVASRAPSRTSACS
jgi:ABC-type polar amino acid transport system ATPase subunit